MDDMKILHVIDSAGMYGAEVMLLNLMEEQKKLGLAPHLLSLGNSNEGAKDLEQKAEVLGIPTQKLRTSNPLTLLVEALRIETSTGRQGVDLIHSHGYKGNIMFGLWPKAFRRIPVISTMHGWTTVNHYSKISIYEKLDRFCLKQLDARVLVTNGHPGAVNFLNMEDERNKVIENGIPNLLFNQDIIKNTEKRFIEFCQNGYVIGSIGRLSPEKGFEYLIESIETLSKEASDYKLVIIGEGRSRDQLEGCIRKRGLEDKVMLLGYRHEAYNFMKFFDIFVLPSLTEGLPITLLEAMQARRPVVAANVGGIPQVLENGRLGMLIEPRDPDNIAHSILHIRKHPEIALRLKNEAFLHVQQKYSCHRMAQEYSDTYKSVIKKFYMN